MLDVAAEAAKAVVTLEELTNPKASSESGKEGSHNLVSTLALNGNEISAAAGRSPVAPSDSSDPAAPDVAGQ